jgi:cell division protein FtsN
MKKILFLAILPAIFIQFIAFAPAISTAHAGPTDIRNQQGFSEGEVSDAFGQDEPTDPRIIIANVIRIVLGFLAVIFLVLLVVAGFKYMTSQGNEEQTGDAKNQIVSAVIGLLIILSAYGVTLFIMRAILRAAN